MLRDGGLVKDGAAGGVEADGEEGGEDLAAGVPAREGRLAGGEGVEVDDGVEEFCGRGSSVL